MSSSDPGAGALTPIAYDHGGVTFRGRLARPAGPGPHPAVLVIHDARGLGDGVARRARALADAGYIALAADMYGDGAFFADPKRAGPAIAPLMGDPALIRARAGAALAVLRDQPGVDPARIGAVGFCLGGRCVLELARDGAAIGGVVSLHGLLTTNAPAAPGTPCPRVLVLTGALDPYAPPADVAAFRTEMDAAGIDHHITIYSHGWHGFSEEEADTMGRVPGVRYDPLLDRLSWAQTLAFLAEATAGSPVTAGETI